MIKYFRKKPVVIEAIQLTQDNFVEVEKFIGYETIGFRFYCHEGDFVRKTNPLGLNIDTLEGVMQAQLGDYIIRGIKGEYYPCKPDIFIQSYDEVIDNVVS